MTKLVIHAGTGTFFDIEDDIYIVNTDDIPVTDIEAFEDLDNGEPSRVAREYGKSLLNYIDIDLF